VLKIVKGKKLHNLSCQHYGRKNQQRVQPSFYPRTVRVAISLEVGDRKVISYLYLKNLILKITLEEKWEEFSEAIFMEVAANKVFP